MSLITRPADGAPLQFPPRPGASVPQSSDLPPAALVARLGRALNGEEIRYCQWKGHIKRSRWIAGKGDLDLLVDRRDAGAFGTLLDRLGFKLAQPKADRCVPGVFSYLGMDPVFDRLVHVHAHYHLVIGRVWRTSFHVPIERAVLDDSVQRSPFRTPSPEHELMLFVLRQALRHDVRDAFGAGDAEWLSGLQPELTHLENQADPGLIPGILRRILPDVPAACWQRALKSLRPGASTWTRMKARREIEFRLRTYAYTPPAYTPLGRLTGLLAHAVPGHGWVNGGGKRLASGGVIVSLTGADGAGKSTCAKALTQWLGSEMLTRRIHLGLPPRSTPTAAVGLVLKAVRALDPRGGTAKPSSLTAHIELLRYVCTARDRYLLYVKARRIALAGGVAICERYPIPEDHALAGPSLAQGMALSADSRLAAKLRRLESRYYTRITTPDLTLVLRIDPDAAVRRKTTEPADYVRHRANRSLSVDWSRTSAIVIDAGRPLGDVLAQLRAHIWETL